MARFNEKIVLTMAKALSLDIGLSMIGLNMLDVDAYFSRLGRLSRSQILVQIWRLQKCFQSLGTKFSSLHPPSKLVGRMQICQLPSLESLIASFSSQLNRF